ncbi:hypothetical protein N0V94_002837 [Neodidymelliopsis sp. IMI 364377]|nr:hypothetical protein N0V94_002837 [Neodidymelliopsis sp. IMI 364377]
MGSPNNTSTGSKGAQYKAVSDKKWKNDWYVRDYPRKSPGGTSIPVDFVTDKVYITRETDSSQNASTHLSLNTERQDATTQASGEITYTEFNISHGSFRVMSRVHGAPGAVAGIFTYLNDTQESDIEIFTRAPTTDVQYSNQPASLGSPTWDPIAGATVNITMPKNDVYTDWHVHRLDWTAARSVFFVDDVQMNETTLQVPVSDPPSAFYIDMWSANSTWTGSMDIGKNATLDILWIEMLFNTTAEIKTYI